MADLRIDTKSQNTTATILRNPDGSIQFPSQIPPVVDFPPFSPRRTASQENKVELPNSAVPVFEVNNRPSAESIRPATKSRQWVTDRPKPATRVSVLPRFRRQGTNRSAVDADLWNTRLREDESSSTSSSSSSEDEDDSKRQQQQDKSPGKAGARRKHQFASRGRQNVGVESGGRFGKFAVENDNYNARGRVSKKDGRLNISVNDTSNTGYLAKALGASFLKNLGQSPDEDERANLEMARKGVSRQSSASTNAGETLRPTLNIVVMVIGSRGDIQPFLKLGKILKEEHGHRVRIATHPTFRDFVQQDSGLEFFSVGGDPSELMAFMVKNPGLIPKMKTVTDGEIGRRRDQMAEMFDGFWRACINATDDEYDIQNLKMMGDKQPFVADAIIANPPSFAHVHCAEKLGIPLHLMFTFPYTPTQAFPHPFANIKKTNVDPGYTNFMSYPLVEMMTWQGLGDLVNTFRIKTLGLEPVSTLWAPGQLYRLKVPYTYLWSPGLVPKPKDWGPEIDVTGFVFLDLASSFEPPADLVKFLDAGEPPIYLGFGSIVVDDPDQFTQMILEAVKEAGVRALVSKGWGGLGDDNVPEGVYMLENTPHDWLFPKVRAVVHHGGAGTTAIGLKCGKPTMIVPFFGDQMFWGSMVGKAGAGADPVPYKHLTKEKLAAGIRQLLTDEARQHAEEIAKDIEEEGDGAKNAVKSFHRSLVLRGEHSMRCSILEDRVAVWSLKNTNLRLSALAAEILVNQKKINWKQLRLIRHVEWNDFEGPGEPITGSANAMVSSITTIAAGLGSIPFKLVKSSKRRQKHEEKKKRKQAQRDARRSKRSGSGSGTIANGKPVNTDTDGRKHKGSPSNHETVDFANGTAHTVPDAKLEKSISPEPTTNSITAPAKGSDETLDNGVMSLHNLNGKPSGLLQRQGTNDSVTDGGSIISADPDQNTAEEIVQDVGNGVAKSGEALARAPIDLSLAIAQGFHNAPRLYGDSTVRRPTRITGIQSGLKSAGEEFVFGIYDGFTGVFTLPYKGARDNGVVGLGKGIGMGLTGFLLKNTSAVIGPFGFALQGVHKQLQLQRNNHPTQFIRKTRIMQGQRDLAHSTPEEKKRDEQAVAHGWSVVQQVWQIMAEKRADGMSGRLKAMRERKTWRANGAFENVEMAEKALKARREGESLDVVFAQQREELEKARRPKKMALEVEEVDAQANVGEDGEMTTSPSSAAT